MKTKLFCLLMTAILAVGHAYAAPFDDLLARFNSHVSAATANQFFQQLLSENFLDEPLQFDKTTPPRHTAGAGVVLGR